MIIRVFRPTIHPGKEREFEASLRDTAVPLVSQQAGLVAQHVGRPRDPSSTEYGYVTVWEDVESVRAFAGERLQEAVITPDEEHLLKDTWIGHYQALRQWAGRWPQRCWAVEGAHGIGRALAQRLVGDGERVVDVPAKLAAPVRVLSVGHGRKSDPDDAVSVAVAARSAPQLRQVGVEDQAVVLHLLTKRRQDLVAARTQTINRLHRLLMDLVPGGARRNLTTKRAAALLAQVAPTSAPAVTRWQLATELVADVRQLEQRIAEVEARIKMAVAQVNTSLLQLFGVGPVLAATFLGEVGDIRRFPSKHHFAAHTGTRR